jgi:hypothetical protein
MSFETCKATCEHNRWPTVVLRKNGEEATDAVMRPRPAKSRGEEIAEKMFATYLYGGEHPCVRLVVDGATMLFLKSADPKLDRVELGESLKVIFAAAINQAIAEEREADARIAEDPETPHEKVYDACDVDDAIREGIALAIRARGSK